MRIEVTILVLGVLVLAVARLMWASYLNHKRWAMHHRERVLAMEKGLPPPPPPAPAGPATEDWLANGFARGLSTSPSAYLLRGLVWLFLGLGTLAFFAAISVTTVRERVPSWFYDQRIEDRKFPPPKEREAPIPVGWCSLGLIPAGVGIAYLIFYRAERRKQKEPPPERA